MNIPVANSSSSKKMKKQNGKQSQVTPDEVVATSSRGRSQGDEPLIAYGYEKPTRVEFIEENQVFNMTVEEDNFTDLDAVDYEDDVSDHKVSFKESNAKYSSENSSDEEEQGEITNPNEPEESSDEVTLTEQQRQVRMMEINQEMCSKFIELQRMMKQGSEMEESVQEAERTLQLLDQGRNDLNPSVLGKNVNINSNKKLDTRRWAYSLGKIGGSHELKQQSASAKGRKEGL